jgi:hypothetical protein
VKRPRSEVKTVTHVYARCVTHVYALCREGQTGTSLSPRARLGQGDRLFIVSLASPE